MAETLSQEKVDGLLNKFGSFFSKKNEMNQKQLNKQKIITQETAKQSQLVQKVSMKMEVMAGKSSSDLFNSGVKELSGGFIDLDSTSEKVSDKFKAISNILQATVILPLARFGLAIKDYNKGVKERKENDEKQISLTKEIQDEEKELLKLDELNEKHKGKLAKGYTMDDKKRRKHLQKELPEKKKQLANLKDNNKNMGKFSGLMRGLIPSLSTFVGILAIIGGLSIYFLGLEKTIELVTTGFRRFMNFIDKFLLFIDDIPGIDIFNQSQRDDVERKIYVRESQIEMQKRSTRMSDDMFAQGYRYDSMLKGGPGFVKENADGTKDIQRPDALFQYIDTDKKSETYGQILDSRIKTDTGADGVNLEANQEVAEVVLQNQTGTAGDQLIIDRMGLDENDANTENIVKQTRKLLAKKSQTVFQLMLARKQYLDLSNFIVGLRGTGDEFTRTEEYKELIDRRTALGRYLNKNKDFFEETTGMTYKQLDSKLPSESLDNVVDKSQFNESTLNKVIDLYKQQDSSAMFLDKFEDRYGVAFSSEGLQTAEDKNASDYDMGKRASSMPMGRGNEFGFITDMMVGDGVFAEGVGDEKEGYLTLSGSGSSASLKRMLNTFDPSGNLMSSIENANGEVLDLNNLSGNGSGTNVVTDNSDNSNVTVNQEPPQPAVTDMSVKESALHQFGAVSTPMPWDQ